MERKKGLLELFPLKGNVTPEILAMPAGRGERSVAVVRAALGHFLCLVDHDKEREEKEQAKVPYMKLVEGKLLMKSEEVDLLITFSSDIENATEPSEVTMEVQEVTESVMA